MAFSLKTYNVMFYEPEGIAPTLKIATAILSDLETRANSTITDIVIPELAKMGMVPENMPVEEFAARAVELPDPVAAKITIPEESRFVVNVRPYEQLGRIPGVLGDFSDMYEKLAPGGIAVTFFNTACTGPANDYGRLAELLDEFPAVRESTWVVTTSLREPIPRAFKERIAERKGGAAGGAGGGSGGKRLAISAGLPCTVPIGDSIVLRAKDEALNVIHERLKYLRKWAGRG